MLRLWTKGATELQYGHCLFDTLMQVNSLTVTRRAEKSEQTDQSSLDLGEYHNELFSRKWRIGLWLTRGQDGRFLKRTGGRTQQARFRIIIEIPSLTQVVAWTSLADTKQSIVGRGSSVRIATRYGLEGPGIEQSKARVCGRSLAGVGGSNPAKRQKTNCRTTRAKKYV